MIKDCKVKMITTVLALALFASIVPAESQDSQQTADDWFNMGNNFYDQGKYDEAIEAYDMAIEINPKLADAWYNKAFTLEQQGRYNEAIKALGKSIELYHKYKDEIDWNKIIIIQLYKEGYISPDQTMIKSHQHAKISASNETIYNFNLPFNITDPSKEDSALKLIETTYAQICTVIPSNSYEVQINNISPSKAYKYEILGDWARYFAAGEITADQYHYNVMETKTVVKI